MLHKCAGHKADLKHNAALSKAGDVKLALNSIGNSACKCVNEALRILACKEGLVTYGRGNDNGHCGCVGIYRAACDGSLKSVGNVVKKLELKKLSTLVRKGVELIVISVIRNRPLDPAGEAATVANEGEGIVELTVNSEAGCEVILVELHLGKR